MTVVMLGDTIVWVGVCQIPVARRSATVRSAFGYSFWRAGCNGAATVTWGNGARERRQAAQLDPVVMRPVSAGRRVGAGQVRLGNQH